MLFTGHIYKITGTCGLVYIGSTLNILNRKKQHIFGDSSNSKLLKKPLHFEIIDSRKYKLVKTLYLVEQFYLDNTININKLRAYSNLFIKRKQKKEYHIKNKEKIRLNQLEKVKCECGCLIARSSIARHKRTSKHINLLNQKSIN